MFNLEKIKNELWAGKQVLWGLLILMLAIALLDVKSFRYLLVFDYDRVLNQHEYWRLITSQFVHWNLAHAVSNLAVFTGSIWLVNSADIRRTLLLMISNMLVLGGALLVLKQSALYAGFSANLYGLVVFLVLTSTGVHILLRWLVVLVIVIKLVLEFNNLISTDAMARLIDASVATDMHLLAVGFSMLFYLVAVRFMVSRKA